MVIYTVDFIQIEPKTNQFPLEISDDNLQLHLKRSQNLIDKYNFALISRYDNYSKFVDSSFDLAEKYGNCFYRNENSAFDLCDHEIVSIL
jgi:hypothetical protein